MVSVLIPVYNAAKYIEESVNSILNQSYGDLEILICDDRSTDESLALIEIFSDPRIKVFKNEINQGYLKTVNNLMAKASGDFLAFQDADDISHQSRIELQVNYLSANPEIVLVGTNYDIINERGEKVKSFLSRVSDPEQIAKGLINENLFQKPSILFRRSLYEKIGGFREGFLKLGNISEDYDWLLRASEHFPLSNIDGNFALYSYRSVPSAMSKGYVKIEQHVGHQVAKFLAKERKENNGVDSLMKEDWKHLNEQIELMAAKYRNDISLFYYEKAESLIFSGLYKEAASTAWQAIKSNPFREKNWRCFLSANKKMILKK